MKPVWREGVAPALRPAPCDPFWIATRDRFGHSKSRDIPSGRSLMPQGSLVFDMPAQPLCPGTTIAEASMQDHFLRLEATHGAGIALSGRIFEQPWQAEIQTSGSSATGRHLLELTWDALEARGTLGLTDWIFTTRRNVPLPVPSALPALLMRRLINNARLPNTAAALALFPLAPWGPPMLPPDAEIRTSRGRLRACDLAKGMELLSITDQPVRLLSARRTAMPALGPWRPLQMRAPYFEASAPLVLPQSQRVIVYGSDVQYMFGNQRALLPLSHLTESTMIRHPEQRPIWTYIALELERSCAMRVNGVPLEMMGANGPRALPRLSMQDLQTLWQFRGL